MNDERNLLTPASEADKVRILKAKEGAAVTLGCVILAAGNASRFGENKLLASFRGRPLIRRAFEAVPRDRLGPVCVVTQYPAVAELAAECGFSVIRNEAPELGLSRSVALGTRALMDRCGGLMFLVADQPLLRRETAAAVADRFLADPARIAVPAAGERQGNPCVFPAALFPELLALTGDRGGKQVIRRHPELVTLVPVSAEELFDVDTLEDLESL
jgi:molybdenum cofactor cytidylyltransferase